MSEEAVTVFLVDDDPEVTASLAWLLESVKIAARQVNSPLAFLQAVRGGGGPVCAVLDLRMSEMSGLELQQQLAAEGLDIPLIFLTAHGDVPAAVNAMQAGAVDFLQKPFNPQVFLSCVNRLIRQARERFGERTEKARLHSQLAKLSKREADVLDALFDGLTSKEIARLLAVSPKTVDVHRANLMRKIGVSSGTELMRLLVSLGYRRYLSTGPHQPGR